MLGDCVSLVYLGLGGNGIRDEGAGRLAAELGHCASLAVLDLRGNGIGAEGAGRLAAACSKAYIFGIRNITVK